MELWDAYDRNFKKIEGITLIRGEESSIPKGIYGRITLNDETIRQDHFPQSCRH